MRFVHIYSIHSKNDKLYTVHIRKLILTTTRKKLRLFRYKYFQFQKIQIKFMLDFSDHGYCTRHCFVSTFGDTIVQEK